MGFVITSDIQPDAIVFTKTMSLQEAITKYLTDWYPGANEIIVKRIIGGEY